MLDRSDLHTYQNECVEIIKDLKKCALFLEMGMGKTTSTLTAVSDLLDYFHINKVLIVAPLHVANNTWSEEIKKWEHLLHLNIKICTGSEKNRLKALSCKDSNIFIINRENIPWLVENVKWNWDALVIDESSSFKSHSSKRFKALKKITKNLKVSILLSGTPSPNSYLDLWSQLYLIDSGERLGRTITMYRQRFFYPDYMGYNYTLRKGAEEEIKSLIKDVCVSMKSEDYLELPDMIRTNSYINLPNNILKKYKELEKDFILELKDKDIISNNAASLSSKLLQMCNGAVYDEDKNTYEIHNQKIKALKDIIEDNSNENFLVAYNFKSDLKRIQKALPEAVKLVKSEQIDEWNKGKIKVLLVHPASAGHGLNLQFGGNITIWFGLTWNLEYYQQLNKRLHRQGQEKPVRIIHILAKDCLDCKIMKALDNKALSQQELVEHLKYS